MVLDTNISNNMNAYSILQNLQTFEFKDLLTTEFVVPILILFITPLIAKLISRAFFHIETTSKRTTDLTRQRIARNLAIASIYLVGLVLFLYSIPTLRALSVGLFASVGVLGIVIGLAAQDSLANLVAGITLAIYQPFRLGDRLRIGDDDGTVEDITLRHTVIKTWENKRIIIPNHILSKDSIVNYTIGDKKALKFLDVSISYDSDIDLARNIMVEEAKKHPDLLLVKSSPDIPAVRVRGLGDSGIDLRLLYWAEDQPTGIGMKFDMLESIKKHFDKEGIEIPFPYRTIIYKKDIPKPKTLNRRKKK